jgi:DNA-binding transcriptional ArsR family regulator
MPYLKTMSRSNRKPKGVLDNVGTSKVLYSLISGKTAPKEIAEDLKIRSPAVIEQLRRLRDAGLVRLGTKDGKYQRYEIDEERVSEILLAEATVYLRLAIEGRSPNQEKMKSFLQFKKEIKENPYWNRFVLGYLKHYSLVLGLEVIPVAQAIDNFENGLRVEVPRFLTEYDLKSCKQIEESKKDLFELLQRWAAKIANIKPLHEGAVNSSIKELVGWQILEDLESARKGTRS